MSKGSKRRPEKDGEYQDQWEIIFGKKKQETKVRKIIPSHAKTQVQKDKTKYNRKAMTKADMLKGPELI